MADRQSQPDVNSGDAILAFVDGDYIVKDYQPKRNGLTLVPKNSKYKSQTITKRDDFEIFGVITGVLRRFKKLNRLTDKTNWRWMIRVAYEKSGIKYGRETRGGLVTYDARTRQSQK